MLKNLWDKLTNKQEKDENGMPVVKIDWQSTKPHQLYTSNIPYYSWVSTADRKGIRKQVSDFATCRESFIHSLRGQIQGKNIKVPKNRVAFLMGKSVRYDSGKAVVEKFRKKFTNDIRIGVQLANAIEAHYNWTHTKMYSVSQTKPYGLAFLITGPSRWMRSPQLLSFYTLLLRLGRISAFENVKTTRGLNQVAKKVVTRSLGGSSCISDRSFLRTCLPYWQLLLDNMDDLYKGKNLERTFHHQHLTNGSGFSEGIQTLCEGHCRDKELRMEWDQLVRDKKIKRV